eukprot:TRINITY_DN28332_c0_g2_i1.p1 TRINITY_DN28332_c0_g2~~TRINITY_DN28332_c0_g2_i1.p1  ORF type:complete len:415 (-),score=85.51 TRINITY_DN28332_c0_g2_i1:32-1276(-)
MSPYPAQPSLPLAPPALPLAPQWQTSAGAPAAVQQFQAGAAHSTGVAQAPALMGAPAYAPRVAAAQPLQVHVEDCYFDTLVAPGATSSPMFAGSPSPRAVAHEPEVYVQSLRAPSSFKALSPEKARKLGFGSTQSVHRHRGRSTDHAAKGRVDDSSVEQVASLNITAVEAALLDADVAALGAKAQGTQDRDVFDLVAACQGSRLLSCLVCFTSQGLLLGASLLTGLLALSASAASSEAVEPSLRGMTMAAAQFCLVGNVLQASHGYESKLAGADIGPITSAGSEDAERDLNLRAWSGVANSAVAAVANVAVLLCCLLGTSAAFAEVGDREMLLRFRAGFGLFAIWPAFLDMKHKVLPLLPVGALMPLLGRGIDSQDSTLLPPGTMSSVLPVSMETLRLDKRTTESVMSSDRAAR